MREKTIDGVAYLNRDDAMSEIARLKDHRKRLAILLRFAVRCWRAFHAKGNGTVGARKLVAREMSSVSRLMRS